MKWASSKGGSLGDKVRRLVIKEGNAVELLLLQRDSVEVIQGSIECLLGTSWLMCFPHVLMGGARLKTHWKDYLSLCQLDSNWCLPKWARREDILDYSAPHTRPGQGKEIQIPSNHNKYIDQVKSIAVLSGFELWLFFSTRFTHNAGRQKKKKKTDNFSFWSHCWFIYCFRHTPLSPSLSYAVRNSSWAACSQRKSHIYLQNQTLGGARE